MDTILLQRLVQDGDLKAFEQLFFRYYDFLFRFAFKYLQNREEAEEVVSDVFFSLWQKREALAEVRQLRVYLYVMVKNQAINCLKKNKKNLYLSVGDIPADVRDQALSPEGKLLSDELIRSIDDAVEELPARCRMIFQLVRMDGLKHREVAQILNISVKTVENQLAIAVQRIAATISCHRKQKKGDGFLRWGGMIFLTICLYFCWETQHPGAF